MFPHTRSITTVLASLGLVLAASACSDRPLPTEQARSETVLEPQTSFAKTRNVKYTFEGVTLVDGERTIENGVIEAGVKDSKHDKNDWTNCSYFTEDWGESLGEYGEGIVPGDGGADAVRSFCVDNFANRQ